VGDHWEGTVPGSFYETPAGICPRPGQRVTITATGEVCWEGRRRCAGPEGSNTPGEEAWGLWARLGNLDPDGPVGARLQRTVGTNGELVFVIPEYRDVYWDPSKCVYYRDNRGEYQVVVTIE
jgi:hypothetical protein